MIRYIILLFLLFWSSSAIFLQQEIENDISLDYADSQFENGLYKSAAKEYLKAYFFDRSNGLTTTPKRIAQCFEELGDQKNAIKYYKIYQRQKELSSDEFSNSLYSIVKILIKNESYKLALAELYQFEDEIIDQDADKYNYYLGMVFTLIQDTHQAKEHIQALSYQNKIDPLELKNLMASIDKNNNKNHFGARVLSTIVPGLGQAVNDEVADGINSLALNGAMLWVFYRISKRLSLWDSIFSVGPWLGRFYVGGIQNAVIASKKKQDLKRTELIEELNTLLIQAYKKR